MKWGPVDVTIGWTGLWLTLMVVLVLVLVTR